MQSCRLCQEDVSDGIYLSDGGLVHYECVKSLENKAGDFANELLTLRNEVRRYKYELARRKTISFKIKSVFSRPPVDSSEIERTIFSHEQKIIETVKSLQDIHSRLSVVYDFYLTYPPDWESRKAELIEINGKYCASCGDTRSLHLHHLVPLSKGGTNKLSNLELLCSDCHSIEHGNRDFSGEYSESETPFSKRVSKIRYAIIQKRSIEFLYRKPNETSYKKRTISPVEFRNFPHIMDNGQTLCIFGYCELRKENRNFALKRMKSLRII